MISFAVAAYYDLLSTSAYASALIHMKVNIRSIQIEQGAGFISSI